MPSQFIEIDWYGIDEMDKALEQIGAALAKQVLQNALKKGAEVIAEEARRIAPRGDDIGPRQKGKQHLADSIIVRTRLNKNQRRLRARAGVEKAFAEVFVGSSAPHAHLVEFGHVLVARGEKRPTTREGRKKQLKTRRVIGSVPPHPFMRPAWEAKKGEAWEVIKAEIWVQLAKTAQRVARQTERGKISQGAFMSLVGAESAA